MKSKHSSGERALRIELVRARAALERQSLARDVRELGEALKPGVLFRGWLPSMAAKARPLDWLGHGLALTRRYPLLASAASTVLSGIGKRHRWWRLGSSLLLGWQLVRSVGKPERGPH